MKKYDTIEEAYEEGWTEGYDAGLTHPDPPSTISRQAKIEVLEELIKKLPGWRMTDTRFGSASGDMQFTIIKDNLDKELENLDMRKK